MRSNASLIGTPTRCCSTSSVNSPPTGSGDFASDDAHAFGQGQARLDAAHDHVDGVGELVDELRLPAPGQAGKDPARQAEAADEGRKKRHDEGQVRRRQPDAGAQHNAADGTPDPERARRHVQPRPLQAKAHRHLLAGLLAALQLLESFGNLAATVLDGIGLRLHGKAPGLVLGHTLETLVGAVLAREVGIEQQKDDGAQRHRRQQQKSDEKQVVAIHARHPLDCRADRAPLQRTGPARDAASHRSIRPVPRSVGGRCRSSDAGR